MSSKGTVRWFNAAKGFGFIQNETSEHIFFHFRDIQTDDKYRQLRTGQNVEFTLTENAKGLAAEQVQPVTN